MRLRVYRWVDWFRGQRRAEGVGINLGRWYLALGTDGITLGRVDDARAFHCGIFGLRILKTEVFK